MSLKNILLKIWKCSPSTVMLEYWFCNYLCMKKMKKLCILLHKFDIYVQYLYNGNFVREEATGEWRRLQNKELYNLHSLDTIRLIKSRKMRWVGHITWMGEKRNTYKVLTRKSEDCELGKLGHRWDTINLYLKETQCKALGWIHLVLLAFWTLSIVQHSEEHKRAQCFGNWISFRP